VNSLSDQQAIRANDPTFARQMLFGLVFECPLQEADACCQFNELRKEPVTDRLAWTSSLTDEECVRRYQAHLACARCKLQCQSQLSSKLA